MPRLFHRRSDDVVLQLSLPSQCTIPAGSPTLPKRNPYTPCNGPWAHVFESFLAPTS